MNGIKRKLIILKVDNLKKEKEVIKNNKEVQDVNKQLEEYGY